MHSGTSTPPFLVIASNDINEDLGSGLSFMVGSGLRVVKSDDLDVAGDPHGALVP